MSGSRRKWSRTRPGPSAATSEPLSPAYRARASCTSRSSFTISMRRLLIRLAAWNFFACACASSSSAANPNPSTPEVSAPGVNAKTFPLNVCVKISGNGLDTRPCRTV